LEFPTGEGLRVDSGVEAGSEITPFYDPMIAKVIAHASSRELALDRLATALSQTKAVGPRTNLALLAAFCRAREFRAGHFDTGFIDRHLAELIETGMDKSAAAIGAQRLLELETGRIAERLGRGRDELPSPWDTTDAFQLSGLRTIGLSILVDGERATAEVSYCAQGMLVAVDGVRPALDAVVIETADAVYVLRGGRQTVVRRTDTSAAELDHASGDGLINAPMHGKVLAVLVKAGDEVTKGQRLAIIEAMKMEHTVTAPCLGRVSEVAVLPGAQVAEGAKLMTIHPTEDSN
jgi:3-methylcrotonyl-CoA carboxylase alpha subunit